MGAVTATERLPATGAWREGDPPGRRRWFTADRPLPLEAMIRRQPA